ncbi:hypothetical protein M0805_005427 [Coniferiporia weirii]|nr:hypothetical protein M0805_005427 [Coniferiporia weirii]
MFNILRAARVNGASHRLFSTTASRNHDLAKLVLIGRLGKDPETRYTSSNKEYLSYVVATTNYPPPPANADGSRESGRTSWHSILCFSPGSFDYLRTLKKGAHVYVEANYELREADQTADPSTPHGQRQIFLRHDSLRLLKNSPKASSDAQSDSLESSDSY